jgi:hypothetical protein
MDTQESKPPVQTPLILLDSEPNQSTKRKVDATSQTEPYEELVAKRAKPALETSKHPIFWNPSNDNTIIQIEQTCFRLHRSWLVKHSKLFEAVFEDTYAGDRARLEHNSGRMSICHVSGTAAEDFAELLAALDKAM